MPESGEGSPDQLARLRAELDAVDSRLIEAAAERQRLVSEIGRVKQGSGRQVRDFVRERQVLDGVRSRAEALGLDGDVAADLLARLIRASLTRQEHERARLVDHGGGRRALIIGGAGRLGSWLADFLENQGFRVLLADPAIDPAPEEDRYADWREVPGPLELTLIACPIGISVGIIEELTERGQPGLILEVASVKSGLINSLRRAAANGLQVCSVHPMFGPDTRLLAGRNVLLMDVGCPAAVTRALELFADTMAEVHEITIEHHDRLMALVLGLSHALNIAFLTALAESGLPATELNAAASTTFARQLAIARDVAAENPVLYFEIQSLNVHGQWSRELLARAIGELAEQVGDNRADDFTAAMRHARSYLQGLN